MFGLVISGRPLNAQPTQLAETQYAFRIPSVPSFSHFSLFLLPGAALPVDVGATVWIQLPGSQDFKLLGALSMQKPSAIFKISGVGNTGAQGGVLDVDAMTDEGESQPTLDTANSTTDAPLQGEIVLGISIEPAAAVEQQLANLRPSAAATTNPQSALVRQQPPSGVHKVSTKVLAQRIIGNAFNFLSSFGDGQSVPIKAFQEWWNKFEKKIDLDPTFLERAEQQ
ncbi:hypothetical protein AAFC00_001948 [Neodothiora populina]|uniref:Hikeshi-like domain-containing protein n=1 Tax=Neodothiora populina TaxID=2781224 RepID=A0ABR3PQW0_9PEZI